MIKDPAVAKAVSKILQRSERHVDEEKLVESFVDVGILAQFENRNNQIFYGRRGTGKTHVLKVLKTNLDKEKGVAAAYIDCRTLGSSSQFSDVGEPINIRCLALFRDIVLNVTSEMLGYVVYNPSDKAEKAMEQIDFAVEATTEPYKRFSEKDRTESSVVTETAASGLKVGISSDPSIGLDLSGVAETKTDVSKSYKIEVQDKIIFPELSSALSKALDMGEFEIYILIDEWSHLPTDLQPYLAEFLKRSVLPLPSVTLKIAALEHRSRFSVDIAGAFIGFELGADISAAQDLDEYYVFDRNPDDITNTYSNMLMRHIELTVDDGYLLQNHGVADGDQLVAKLFTERKTFQEVARASEGVIRDLINIFTLSFFNAQRRGRDSIDRKAVIESARQWFEQDKQTHLDGSMNAVLRRIVDDVIGKRLARSFLLPRDLQKHPMIQKLFDARVLHLMQRGYADKDNPGIRYNIYTLDYGTYVDLLGTAKEPVLGLVEQGDGEDIVVPFDDKRSIRRIVLSEEVLN